MKFTVTWTPTAEAILTRIWLASRDREAIREATARIETLLANEPLTAGESRSGNYRIVFEEPLAVTYSVWPADRRVKVVFLSRSQLRR